MYAFTALKTSLWTLFPEAISHLAGFKNWLNIDVDNSKLPRYKKKFSQSSVEEDIPSYIARHKAVPDHEDQGGHFSWEYVIPSLVCCTHSKLLFAEGMMMENGLLQSDLTWWFHSSSENGYSINK